MAAQAASHETRNFLIDQGLAGQQKVISDAMTDLASKTSDGHAFASTLFFKHGCQEDQEDCRGPFLPTGSWCEPQPIDVQVLAVLNRVAVWPLSTWSASQLFNLVVGYVDGITPALLLAVCPINDNCSSLVSLREHQTGRSAVHFVAERI